jgi:hypothetical protein
MRRIGTVLAIFLALATFTGFAWAAASTAPSASPVNATWSHPAPVPGVAALIEDGAVVPDVWVAMSISCTGPGDCAAGGAYQDVSNDSPDTDQAYVVSEVNGTWGNAEAVPGTLALNTAAGAGTTAVSCSSPGNCAAVGYYAYLHGKAGAVGVAGFVASQVNGTWQLAQPVRALSSRASFSEMTAVSCAPATTAAARSAGPNCVAVGVSRLAKPGSVGFVLADANGTWGTARAVPGLPATAPGSAVTAVSCALPGSCAIGGYYHDTSGRQQVFVANEVNGAWRKAQRVPDAAALNEGDTGTLNSVSCPAAGACVAAGTYRTNGNQGELFVVREVAGRWQGAIQLPGSGKLITYLGSTIGEVSCTSAATCEVGGTLQTGKSTTRGFLAAETNGRWDLYVLPDGAGSTITGLSCPAPGYCAAGGQRLNSPSPTSFPASMMVIDEVAGHWGKTVSLDNAYIGATNTISIYGISCAAPRSCGAVGNLAAYHGLPFGIVANETPAK